MLCTICKKPLHPTKDDAVVWRTYEPVQSKKPKQWANMPIHNKCVDLIDGEIMKNKILAAAGHTAYEFSKTNPKTREPIIQVNDDGQHQVFVSDGVYEWKDIKI